MSMYPKPHPLSSRIVSALPSEAVSLYQALLGLVGVLTEIW